MSLLWTVGNRNSDTVAAVGYTVLQIVSTLTIEEGPSRLSPTIHH